MKERLYRLLALLISKFPTQSRGEVIEEVRLRIDLILDPYGCFFATGHLEPISQSLTTHAILLSEAGFEGSFEDLEREALNFEARARETELGINQLTLMIPTLSV